MQAEIASAMLRSVNKADTFACLDEAIGEELSVSNGLGANPKKGQEINFTDDRKVN